RYGLQCLWRSCLPRIPLSTRLYVYYLRGLGTGRVYGRAAGGRVGRAGSGDYERRHRSDPGGGGRGGAIDVQAESRRTDGIDHGIGRSADGGDGSEFGVGAGG